MNSCSTCQKYHNSQQKEPMMPSEIPSRQWKTVNASVLWTTVMVPHGCRLLLKFPLELMREKCYSQKMESQNLFNVTTVLNLHAACSNNWQANMVLKLWHHPPTTRVAMGSLNTNSTWLRRWSWNAERLKKT